MRQSDHIEREDARVRPAATRREILVRVASTLPAMTLAAPALAAGRVTAYPENNPMKIIDQVEAGAQAGNATLREMVELYIETSRVLDQQANNQEAAIVRALAECPMPTVLVFTDIDRRLLNAGRVRRYEPHPDEGSWSIPDIDELKRRGKRGHQNDVWYGKEEGFVYEDIFEGASARRREVLAAWARHEAVRKEAFDRHRVDELDELYWSTNKQVRALGRKIATTRALSLADVLLKACVLADCYPARDEEIEIDAFGEATDCLMSAGVARDLIALTRLAAAA